MLENELFRGKLVRLAAENAQEAAAAFSKWSRDSEYFRLLSSGAAQVFSLKATKEWLEKDQEKEKPDFFSFAIRTLENERLIGSIGLDGVQWTHGDAFVGIGLGEREYWGRGYGTDAMCVILRYAFTELNLHRVSLNVFAYNPRAVKSYEKAGFKHEGRMRQMLYREGKRWDMMFMGITKREWIESQ